MRFCKVYHQATARVYTSILIFEIKLKIHREVIIIEHTCDNMQIGTSLRVLRYQSMTSLAVLLSRKDYIEQYTLTRDETEQDTLFSNYGNCSFPLAKCRNSSQCAEIKQLYYAVAM